MSYSFSRDFKNYTNQSTEYTYDGNGNMTAGYVAAIHGLSWMVARFGFDEPQKIQDNKPFVVEGISSQYAQAYGFMLGKRRLMSDKIRK